jgi:hypothetical protein
MDPVPLLAVVLDEGVRLEEQQVHVVRGDALRLADQLLEPLVEMSVLIPSNSLGRPITPMRRSRSLLRRFNP